MQKLIMQKLQCNVIAESRSCWQTMCLLAKHVFSMLLASLLASLCSVAIVTRHACRLPFRVPLNHASWESDEVREKESQVYATEALDGSRVEQSPCVVWQPWHEEELHDPVVLHHTMAQKVEEQVRLPHARARATAAADQSRQSNAGSSASSARRCRPPPTRTPA